MMESLPQVYLAGGKGYWRENLYREWSGKARCYNPFADSRQGSVYEFTNDDLSAIRSSVLVFGVLDYPRYTGLALEFGYAHALGTPIIYVHLPNVAERVDSMMAGVATAIFVDLDAAMEFAEERYL